MTTLAVTSVNSLFCHASTCFGVGSKLRCIRSRPPEMQSMSENDFECLASPGVNKPETMFPNRTPVNLDVPPADPSFTPPPRCAPFCTLARYSFFNGISPFKAGAALKASFEFCQGSKFQTERGSRTLRRTQRNARPRRSRKKQHSAVDYERRLA